ncbi:MAG: 16S rRNA (uracil(1498)-N(3))-methyltransferase [Chitinophagales bacterium]|nr:16S rRNA (uracil(1498)-N(3))-methyltransferase [Chitinophagales bacterium]
MELFYSNRVEDHLAIINNEEYHHCMKVMRHNIGDELLVTDGQGKLFHTKIISDDKTESAVEILKTLKEEIEPSPSIHIAIAPTKNNDRFEWFLEKATEIGVSEITPIICTRSERNQVKQQRLNKILISAMKQSMRLWLPKLNEIEKFENFLKVNSPLINSKFICHCQSQNLPALKNRHRERENVRILIGPEGDFTLEEINLAESNGFISVNLGDSRLRTETAGLVAIHTIQLNR